MKYFIVYNLTGEILRTGECQDCDVVNQKNSLDELVMEGEAGDYSHWIDTSVIPHQIKTKEE